MGRRVSEVAAGGTGRGGEPIQEWHIALLGKPCGFDGGADA